MEYLDKNRITRKTKLSFMLFVKKLAADFGQHV